MVPRAVKAAKRRKRRSERQSLLEKPRMHVY
jgi:hypothetical protein